MLKAIFLTDLNFDYAYSHIRAVFRYKSNEFFVYTPNVTPPKDISIRIRGYYHYILNGDIQIISLNEIRRTKSGGYEVEYHTFSQEQRKRFLEYYYR